jgi:hypothetical protein
VPDFPYDRDVDEDAELEHGRSRSSTKAGKRWPLAEAAKLAAGIAAVLSPACSRLEIAGSVRRRVHTVADVELVAIPRYRVDLFGERVDEPTELDRLVDELVQAGRFAPRLSSAGIACMGSKAKRLTAVRSGLPVDLFGVLPPRCKACGYVQGTDPKVSRVRPPLRGEEEASRCEALLEGLRGQDAVARRNEEAGPQPPSGELRDLRSNVHEHLPQGSEDVLDGVRRQAARGGSAPEALPVGMGDAAESARRPDDLEGGLRPGVRAGSSEPRRQGVRGGASPGGREVSGPLARAERMGPSPERREDGQPAREPGDRDARGAGGSRDLSVLRPALQGPLNPWQCPRCGGDDWGNRSGSQWGALLAIRTGPADYSRALVTKCKERGLDCVDGRLVARGSGRELATPEEADFIRACGMSYLEPWERR